MPVRPFLLLDNWTGAGRTALRLTAIGADALRVPEQKVKEIRDTVATLRGSRRRGAGPARPAPRPDLKTPCSWAGSAAGTGHIYPICAPKAHAPPRFSPRGPVSSVDPWYRFHPLFFRYYWYKGILSQNQRTFNRQCIKLHARAPHRKSAQMPTHEAFVHPFRLPRRGEERAHFNFCCAFAQQKTERPRGVVLSLSESLAEFASADAK